MRSSNKPDSVSELVFSGTPYGVLTNRNGSGLEAFLGALITVCRRTPSRIGIMTSWNVKFSGLYLDSTGGAWAKRPAAIGISANSAIRLARNILFMSEVNRFLADSGTMLGESPLTGRQASATNVTKNADAPHVRNVACQ